MGEGIYNAAIKTQEEGVSADVLMNAWKSADVVIHNAMKEQMPLSALEHEEVTSTPILSEAEAGKAWAKLRRTNKYPGLELNHMKRVYDFDAEHNLVRKTLSEDDMICFKLYNHKLEKSTMTEAARIAATYFEEGEKQFQRIWLYGKGTNPEKYFMCAMKKDLKKVYCEVRDNLPSLFTEDFQNKWKST